MGEDCNRDWSQARATAKIEWLEKRPCRPLSYANGQDNFLRLSRGRLRKTHKFAINFN